MDLDRLEAIRENFHKIILEEAFGQSIPELNEPGWTQAGRGASAVTGLDRVLVNEQAARYFHTDPVARHLIRLNNAYTFARGISVRAADAEINDWLKKFWNHPRNRDSISRAKSQWRLGRDMQLNGEVFFALYTSTLTGRVTVRSIPPNQIKEIRYADGDADTPTHFIRTYKKSNKDVIEEIPDYRFAGEPYKPDATTEVCIMHAIGNEHGGRGISDLATVIPWIKALKGFMEDRATLTLALSTFAFRQKIKGNSTSLSRAAAQWGTYETELRYGYGDGRERRQGANTLIENEASTLDQIKTDSGAGNAYQDMRMFRQQAGIGDGIFEHYLGDPSTGNLATATAMELPMLKLFEYTQEFWSDVIEEILEFVIRQGMRFDAALNVKGVVDVDYTGGTATWVIDPSDGIDISTEVIFPPIVQSDLTVWSTALAQIKQSESLSGQQILPSEQAAQIALKLFGYGAEGQAIISAMKENGFKLPVAPPNFSSQSNGYQNESAAPIMEADQPKTDVGKALPKAEAERVAPVTKKELQDEANYLASLPSLAELAKKYGLTEEELLDA